MTTIFEHTDEDGDRFEVEESITHRGWLIVETLDDSIDDGAAVYLTPRDVTRLREALKPFDPAAASATTPAPTIEVGREYRLLPGAHSGTAGRPESCFEDATRVRVERATPDSDGDVRVTILDGRNEGSPGWYAHSRFLAPLDEAPPTPLAEWHDAMRTWRTITTGDEALTALRARLAATDRAADVLDPVRVAAVEKAFAILGADGHAVDVETWLAVADYLAGDE